MLAAPSVSAQAREAALELAEAGEQITVQRARDVIEAQRGWQHAQEAARLAQAQLAEEQARSHEAITRLTQRLAALEEEKAALSAPVEVIPAEVTARLARLEQQIQTVTGQRDNLSQKAQELAEELAQVRTARGTERAWEIHAFRICQQWHTLAGTFVRQTVKLLSQFPSPWDTRAFDAPEWEQLAQLEATAQRLLNECRALREAPQKVIVDGT